jgi:hypothetical protein
MIAVIWARFADQQRPLDLRYQYRHETESLPDHQSSTGRQHQVERKLLLSAIEYLEMYLLPPTFRLLRKIFV